jgi:hypothetical protein
MKSGDLLPAFNGWAEGYRSLLIESGVKIDERYFP